MSTSLSLILRHMRETGRPEWNYPALIRAEAKLVGRENVRIAVDRVSRLSKLWVLMARLNGLGSSSLRIKTGFIRVVDSQRVTPNEWPLPKLRKAIDRLLEKKQVNRVDR